MKAYLFSNSYVSKQFFSLNLSHSVSNFLFFFFCKQKRIISIVHIFLSIFFVCLNYLLATLHTPYRFPAHTPASGGSQKYILLPFPFGQISCHVPYFIVFTKTNQNTEYANK